METEVPPLFLLLSWVGWAWSAPGLGFSSLTCHDKCLTILLHKAVANERKLLNRCKKMEFYSYQRVCLSLWVTTTKCGTSQPWGARARCPLPTGIRVTSHLFIFSVSFRAIHPFFPPEATCNLIFCVLRKDAHVL